MTTELPPCPCCGPSDVQVVEGYLDGTRICQACEFEAKGGHWDHLADLRARAVSLRLAQREYMDVRAQCVGNVSPGLIGWKRMAGKAVAKAAEALDEVLRGWRRR